ncbi:polysaccharide biosynthesis C-terminal domain-containing protein, partial [Enterococcus faecium]|uniref:lipopolysaccharide biosynthesis protein n=2 Tax=Enterococcus TaxID=1350 RepID=UPI002090FEAA
LVLLPRMTDFFAKENVSRIVRMMEKTIHLQLYFSIPIMFGMLTVYDKLVPWFFGEKFIYINNVIPYFSTLIVIMPLGVAISRQYLMPIGNIKEYNKSVIVGAIINIVANLILLPTIGFFGVVFSNILSECFVTFVRTRSFLKSTDFKFEYRKIGIFLLGGMLMCIVTRYLTSNLSSSILTNLIQFAIALPIYLTITTLFKANPFLDLLRKK